jgi:hypothetical protein
MGHNPTNRFEKHRVLAVIILFCGVLLAMETVLRIVNPASLDFAYRFRQINRYHPKWQVDAQPNSTSFIRLQGSGPVDVLSFLVTINDHGFRTWDRVLDNNVAPSPTATRIVHALGDSFTMGWGVNYEASYPALLDLMLPENVRVINLGVNGMGTIGATEKSIHLWKQFPADLAVYLFFDRNYERDVNAKRHSQLPAVAHIFYDGWNWMRQNTYVANCPYALVYRFRFEINVGRKDLPNRKIIFQNSAQDINVSAPPANPSDPAKGQLSKDAILAYKKILDERNVPLIVLTLGPQEFSQDFYSFCREHHIEAYYFTTPEDLLLRKEGHFNQLGNYRVAQFVAKLVQTKLLMNQHRN